jgi:hypothetical protein
MGSKLELATNKYGSIKKVRYLWLAIGGMLDGMAERRLQSVLHPEGTTCCLASVLLDGRYIFAHDNK